MSDNIPELRFKEFIGTWKEVFFGEIAKFSKGKGISKSDIDLNGRYSCIRYGELYTIYNETISEVVSKTNINEKYLIFSEANDVIIPASGETPIDIATASCVINNGVALGGDINIIKTKNNGVFISFYLNNKKKYEIASLAQGKSVVHLYPAQLQSLVLNLPSLDEQQKIAAFLTTIDNRIQALRKKRELLEQYMNGAMQQIFSQEIRFKDDDGKEFPEWEKITLADIVERRIGKNRTNIYKNVYTNSAQYGILNQKDFFDKDIANKNNLTGYYIVEKDDFVYNPRISTLAPVGPLGRNHLDTGIMSPLYSVFRIKSGNLDFFEYYFKHNIWHEYMESIANYGARADRMNITNSEFFRMPISVPSLREQEKIARFLSAIDGKINIISKQLLLIVNYKKGLLQKMFV